MERPHGSLGTTEIHELITANRRRALIYRDAGIPGAADRIMVLVDAYLDELGHRVGATPTPHALTP